MAIRGDDELDELLKGVIAGGGVAPHIQTHLFPSNSPSMSSVLLSNLNNQNAHSAPTQKNPIQPKSSVQISEK